jgi:hypothetical protein
VQDPDAPLVARILDFVTPTDTDIRRAVRAVLRTLEDGRNHWSGDLGRVVLDDRGAPQQTLTSIQFSARPTASDLREDDPFLTQLRGRWAALEALAELEAQGVIVPAKGPTGQHEQPMGWLPERVGLEHPGGSYSLSLVTWAPAVQSAYRLAHGAGRHSWYLSPNLFLEELDDLQLEERARRALEEGLRAYRRGLHLACASMLGVVFEAAWHRAALLVQTAGLMGAVRDGETARLQRNVAEALRNARALSPTGPDELLAHAALMRELRNYGVHPAGSPRDDLERYLAEEGCGWLILQTHHYLTRLAAAVGHATAPHG